MRAALLVLLVGATACGKSSHKAAAVIDPLPINAAVKALGDRACGCNNDPGCVKLVRVDWDASKKGWIEARKSFLPGPAVVYDTESARMAACGDAAGVTFWREL